MKTRSATPMLPSRLAMERAFSRKDASYDGVFYAAVKTTGVFCRPSCPSRPLAAHVEFYASPSECLAAGFRACKRCRPLEASGAAPDWVVALKHRLDAAPAGRLVAADWNALAITPERARRWFVRNQGMTFAAWCRGRRLEKAFTALREGRSVDDVVFDSGFESYSGFRDAFRQAFGTSPARSRAAGGRLVVTLLESPLGPMLAGADDDGIRLLDFADRRSLVRTLGRLRGRAQRAIVPGDHPLLDGLRRQLAEYFAGARRAFALPLAPQGTPFQQRVWAVLGRIPYGTTMSYDDLARRIGQPSARRAVAAANGANPLCLLIPCHRVIGKNGQLTGYAGGLWRKRRLLALEQSASR